MTALLAIENLTVDYRAPGRRLRAVDGVTLSLRPGEVLALVGESGSGKSTIARAVMGTLPPEAAIVAGRIGFAGQDLVTLPERRFARLRGRSLGFVPQDPMVGLNPLQRIGHQVAEPLRIHHGLSRREAEQRAVELLRRVGLPDPESRARQFPHELSGGMRQRVLIAAALACGPKLLIADEPTTALDVTVQKVILDDLTALARSGGIAVLLITHDLALAGDRADRIGVLQDGRLVEHGPPEAVLGAPAHPYTRTLIRNAPGLSAAPRAGRPARPDGGGPELVRVVGVTKEYRLPERGRFRAVDDVTLGIGRGETLGLVGESGSGKSTLARMILGLTAPTGGRVEFDGADVGGLHRAGLRALRRRAQLVYQNPYASLNPRLTVAEIVGEPLLGFRIGDRAARRRRVAELLDRVGLGGGVAGRRPVELSGGQRQRVAIARALAPEPELLVCDEPVSALDVTVQAQILDLLAELRRELGLSMLFISHDLAVIQAVADRVAVMRAGRLVELGPTDEVFLRPAHEYTRLLLEAVPGRARAGEAVRV